VCVCEREREREREKKKLTCSPYLDNDFLLLWSPELGRNLIEFPLLEPNVVHSSSGWIASPPTWQNWEEKKENWNGDGSFSHWLGTNRFAFYFNACLPACLPAYLRGSFYAVLVLLLARVLGGAVFGPLPPSLPSPPPRHPSRSLVPPRNPFATEKDPAFINFGTHSNKRLVSSHNASLLLPFQITSIHIRMINVCWFHFSKLNIYHPYMYGCDLKVTYC
jgi:hypothetical protein